MELSTFVTKVSGLARPIRAWTLAIGMVSSALVGKALAVDINQHGLTGSWYQPEMSGQGIMLEVYPDALAPGVGFLQGSWFTFKPIAPWDYDQEHRWYTFSGTVLAGQSSATLTLYQNLGGNFDALPATSAVAIGSVVLNFQDCVTATLRYAFTDYNIYRSGTIPLTRLTPNVTCSDSENTPANADFGFGYSGNWFDPATSGQGFVFEVNPTAAVVFFAWFTYLPNEPPYGEGQLWYTGQGPFFVGPRTLPVTLYETLGNSFDSGDPHLAFNGPVGTATITFLSCDTAQLAFTLNSSITRAGTINLSRVGPTPAECVR